MLPGGFMWPGFSPGGGIDPATLPLTSYILGQQYSAGSVPLIPTAGVAATTTFNGPGGATSPTVGASLNGLSSIRFSRASSQYMTTGAPLGAFVSASRWMYGVVYAPVSEVADADVGHAYNNEAIFSDVTDGGFVIAMRQTGASFMASQYTGSLPYSGQEVASSNGAPHFYQAYFDGSNVYVRVDSGLWIPGASGNAVIGVNNIFIGANYDSTKYINGDMWSQITADVNTVSPQATFDGMKAFYNTMYAQSF